MEAVRAQLLRFRVPELQEVAERLRLDKRGRKAQLQSRLLAYLGLEEGVDGPAPTLEQWKLETAIRTVADVHARRSAGTAGAGPAAGPPAPAAAPAHPAAAPAHPAAPQAAPLHPPGPGAVPLAPVRCLCSSGWEHGPMLQCQEPGCGVRQHAGCVAPHAGPRPAPALQAAFRCERCRAALADPFWTLAEPDLLPPALLKPMPGRAPVLTTQGMQGVQGTERIFYLSSQQIELVTRHHDDHRIQLGCICLADEVPCRFHWPRNMELRCNGVAVRPTHRANNAKMGVNARDDAADISALCVRGRNSLVLVAADAGGWACVLQHTRRSPAAAVATLALPAEGAAEAAHRVARLVAGDAEDVAVSHQVVGLRCPMSGVRMARPARFADASGLQAFDMHAFLSLAARNRKWQDPITLRNSTIKQLQPDTYMAEVLAAVSRFPDIEEVELGADGRWRPVGRACGPFDIRDGVEGAAAAIAGAASGMPAGSARVKAEADAAEGASGSGGDHGAASLAVDSETDEEEELRAAAAAVKNLARPQKRAAPEVIDLLDSSDDEMAAARAPRPGPPATANARAPPPSPPTMESSGSGASRYQQPSAPSGASTSLRPLSHAAPAPPHSRVLGSVEAGQQQGGPPGSCLQPTSGFTLAGGGGDGSSGFLPPRSLAALAGNPVCTPPLPLAPPNEVTLPVPRQVAASRLRLPPQPPHHLPDHLLDAAAGAQLSPSTRAAANAAREAAAASRAFGAVPMHGLGAPDWAGLQAPGYGVCMAPASGALPTWDPFQALAQGVLAGAGGPAPPNGMVDLQRLVGGGAATGLPGGTPPISVPGLPAMSPSNAQAWLLSAYQAMAKAQAPAAGRPGLSPGMGGVDAGGQPVGAPAHSADAARGVDEGLGVPAPGSSGEVCRPASAAQGGATSGLSVPGPDAASAASVPHDPGPSPGSGGQASPRTPFLARGGSVQSRADGIEPAVLTSSPAPAGSRGMPFWPGSMVPLDQPGLGSPAGDV
ncbi:SIZ1 [Auxenochlorella protothecoides x Auxenochlorella symbiontica]